MQHVLLGTTTREPQVSVDFNHACVQTACDLLTRGFKFSQRVANGGMLDIARNTVVDYFLSTDATDLLFVDADVGWDYRAVARILADPHEIVGGLVPRRNSSGDDAGTFHQNALTGVIEGGLFQSLELPTAFMRIKRSAFAKLKKPYFKLNHSPTETGEDIYFCRRWIETGNFLWVDPDITFSHRGSYVWHGNFYNHCVSSGFLTKEAA